MLLTLERFMLGGVVVVSVIIPAYNASPYIQELLESLSDQDIGAGNFEVIVVDDGSTDGSAELIDVYCASHAGFRAIHQDNSGRPGRPRNAGLRVARGRYVFFADSDDLLSPSALRELTAFADTHESDVVIPRLTPLGGRTFPMSVYKKTLVDTPLTVAFETLFPQKLYRRSLLSARDIWFPEGRRLDDGVFNALAYVHARRISILSEGEYYFLRARPDGANLTKTEKNPATYTESVTMIAEIVRRHVQPPSLADDIIGRLYCRKCLLQYGDRYHDYPEELQSAWVAAHVDFAKRFITDEIERALPPPFRERSHFVRRGDRTGLLTLRSVEAAPQLTASQTEAVWTGEGLRVSCEVAVVGRMALPRQILCVLTGSDDTGASGFTLHRAGDEPHYGQSAPYSGVFAAPSVRELVPGAYDVRVVARVGGERLSARPTWAAGVAMPAARDGLAAYSTKSGGFAVKKREQSAYLRGGGPPFLTP